MEKARAPHSSILAWKIPWTEEPGRLQSMGSRRVGHDWATSLSLFTFMHWRRKWQPTPVFLPGEPRDGGAWWAAVYGVTQSRTRLKRLSSSSSSSRRWSWNLNSVVCPQIPNFELLLRWTKWNSNIKEPIQCSTTSKTALTHLGLAISRAHLLRDQQWRCLALYLKAKL